MKRIVIRSNIYECNYPYDMRDSEGWNEYLKKELRKFDFVRVLLFENMNEATEWSRNAILNPNLLSIDDLL